MAGIHSWRTYGITTIGVLVLLLVISQAGAHTVDARRGGVACPALGTYTVNRLYPPPIVPAQRGPNTAPSYAYPFWWTSALTGTITLSAYSGCGAQTTGSFSVHLAPRYGGPVPEAPQRSNAIHGTAILLPPYLAGTTVLTATGTIVQDATHAKDSSYVLVTATIVYGRQMMSCPPICGVQPNGTAIRCVPVACEAPEVITRVAAFSGITGFLRWQPGNPAEAALSFLPPPDPKAQSVSAALATLQPINLLGWRTGS